MTRVVALYLLYKYERGHQFTHLTLSKRVNKCISQNVEIPLNMIALEESSCVLQYNIIFSKLLQKD